jgi:hypothetical protein
MEQTAVEWLVEKLTPMNWSKKQMEDHFKDIIFQAKEMEKEQIMDGFYVGSECNYDGSYLPEQYYNETFKSE